MVINGGLPVPLGSITNDALRRRHVYSLMISDIADIEGRTVPR